MVRHNDAERIRPFFGKIKPIRCSGAMEEDQRLAFARRIHNGLNAVDVVGFACELAHRPSPFEVARGRSRGMTSSAKRVRLSLVRECGMSATCITLLI